MPVNSLLSAEDKRHLRILIADDNDADRLLLSTIVRKQGHEVITAADGREAVSRFISEHPDLVLLDALMPEVDGFAAAREIKTIAGDDIVPIIFLTSLQDAESLAECLSAGGDDFLSKPYSRVILQAKISALGRLRRLNQRVLQQNEHLVEEQRVAKAVFDNIAHRGALDDDNIRYLLSPMAVFNGDMLLAADTPSGNQMVMLGDFTGHGLPAAIGAMPASEIFYGMVAKGFSMSDILRELNTKLRHILPTGVFCCVAMAELNFREETVTVWNGGLPAGLIRRCDGTMVSLQSRHLPLGIVETDRLSLDMDTYEVFAGDHIYFWSDGILEASNPQGEMFGEERLLALIAGHDENDSLLEHIESAVAEFVGEDIQDDDHTFIDVVVKAPSATAQEDDLENLRGNQASGPMDWSMEYELRPSTLRQFNPLPVVTHLLMEVPILKLQSSKIHTILSELFSNALDHGVLGLSSAMKSSPDGFAEYYRLRQERLEALEDAWVRIFLDHKPTPQGGRLLIRIEDSGPGFDYRKTESSSEEMSHEGLSGRGIPLVKEMCSEFRFLGAGNCVEAVYEWEFVH